MLLIGDALREIVLRELYRVGESIATKVLDIGRETYPELMEESVVKREFDRVVIDVTLYSKELKKKKPMVKKIGKIQKGTRRSKIKCPNLNTEYAAWRNYSKEHTPKYQQTVEKDLFNLSIKEDLLRGISSDFEELFKRAYEGL